MYAQGNNFDAFTPICLLTSKTIRQEECNGDKMCFILLYNFSLRHFSL
jgi:hypothetical protein